MEKEPTSYAIPVLCASCKGRNRGVCGALDHDQLAELAGASCRSAAGSGAALLWEAERVDNYANILSGVVKLSKTLSDGRQQIVGLQFSPDFLGRPFRSDSAINAQAATDVTLCSFPKAAVERMLRESPELERRLYNQALDELDEARDWMVTLGRKTASEKIASLLLMIAHHTDPSMTKGQNASRFDLPLSRADIADFLGLTVETVSRQLTRLRDDKVISIENNRQIVVPDLRRLKARAGN
ncbi:Crp/Fnr family transcriptional regulator [Pelagibacterium sediminicola]|uniref:Crp/Fnr family transcriptional regulator n=1 Tax=Pelagibacterium sediminicola TaxID=2248761 RepID=UPI000E324A5E|nr:Crp/Fnr family transcriptional regulator [Pelagibacterium sediminicola]